MVPDEFLVAGDGEATLDLACTKFVLLSALESRRGRR
ncbi:hypothetical protein JOE26_003206 [Rhodococcus coprophilus]|nr:hypothetical protein [Rhodococcus coprophilus]